MNLNNQTTVNVQEKSNLIWAIADLIRDFYKPHEYGKVILPMTVIKRFNDTLAPTKAKVLETYDKVKHTFYENVAKEDIQIFMFDDVEPEVLGVNPDHCEQLRTETKTGFNPFYYGN